jgi:hypothetical protein
VSASTWKGERAARQRDAALAPGRVPVFCADASDEDVARRDADARAQLERAHAVADRHRAEHAARRVVRVQEGRQAKRDLRAQSGGRTAGGVLA